MPTDEIPDLESDPNEKLRLSYLAVPEGRRLFDGLIHFAITLASEGERVILIDSNLRSPYLHKAFRMKLENGLTSLSCGKLVDEVIKENAV